MKKIILYFLSIIVLSSFFSYEIEAKIKPRRPRGEQGIKGPTGNANVIIKNITFQTSDFVEGPDGEKYSASKTIPEITNSVYQSGAVMVYYEGSGTTPPPYYPLPTELYQSSYSYKLTYAHRPQTLVVQRYDSDLTAHRPSSDLNLKVVIIPGSGKIEWDVDFEDYYAAKEYYSL